MVYNAEAVLPCHIIHDSPRVRMYEEREVELDRQDSLDALEEERNVAKTRSTFYQQQACRYQSREVQAKTRSTPAGEEKGQNQAQVGGSLHHHEVLTGGVYRLRDASDNRLGPNPWNAARLRRFYA